MEDLLTVRTFPTRPEAEIGRGKLEANGIKALVIADDAGGQEPFLANATGYIKLVVSRSDFETARKILG